MTRQILKYKEESTKQKSSLSMQFILVSLGKLHMQNRIKVTLGLICVFRHLSNVCLWVLLAIKCLPLHQFYANLHGIFFSLSVLICRSRVAVKYQNIFMLATQSLATSNRFWKAGWWTRFSQVTCCFASLKSK